MATTLRLSTEAEQALNRIVHDTHLSKNAATERAILEMDARTSQVERAAAFMATLKVRDADLLARLADA
jgi:predicted transcriptional regulator